MRLPGFKDSYVLPNAAWGRIADWPDKGRLRTVARQEMDAAAQRRG